MESGGEKKEAPKAPERPMAPAGKKGIGGVWIAVLVFIVAIVLLVVSMTTILYTGTVNPATVWDPQPGQYLEYDLMLNGTVYAAQRVDVVWVNSTTVTTRITTTLDGQTGSMLYTANRSEPAGAIIDLDDPPSPYSVSTVGTSYILTAWGMRGCDHYQVSYPMEDMSMVMDLYVYRNVLVKMEVMMAGTTTGMILTGTNIPVLSS